ncbi:MAG TPA: ABC transporter substrate-binding protein [Opitutaceae bacterium]|nr:ABC transporter substrate-binding protein [Opitutaceae bacterium]
MKGLARFFLGYVVVAAGIFVLLLLVGLGFRPDVSSAPPSPPAELVEKVEASRNISLNLAHPPVVAREVNYAEASAGTWWPKKQSPLLAELEHEGKLPPLTERVGPEPAVLEGCEGLGRYGGTWYRLANSERDVLTTQSLLNTPTLMRWSPQGYPLVPYIAKAIEASPDQREFTFTLRRGMKWSDGAPFTADDILFWWQWEVLYFKQTPRFMTIAGQMGTVEKIDDLHVRFKFPLPNPYFPSCAARAADQFDILYPAHYLRQFHPKIGDQALIRKMMSALKLGSAVAVYRRMKEWRNPECPRLSPWLYRTFQASAPYTFVRNPYFCAVDSAGNQLPYLDRIVIDVKTPSLIPIAASNGEISMQARSILYEDHTLLLGGMQSGDYRVLHWFPATRSVFTIFPVLNRRVDPAHPETAKKAALLNEPRFRQALSLAINRRAIIDAVFNGQGEPAQLDGGPLSDFHSPELFKSFTAYDPARAGALLDAIGLTKRDHEGFRTFQDGSRMTFFLHFTAGSNTTQEPAQFVIDDWARVGVRVILQIEGRPLFYARKASFQHDFDVWIGNSEFDPLLDPRNFVPTFGESFFAPGYGLWYRYGGLYGDPTVRDHKGALAPPPNHPLRREMELLDQAYTSSSREAARQFFQGIQHIAAENVWSISIATAPPQLVVVKNGFRNVPDHAIAGTPYMTPANTGIETYFWDKPTDSPGTVAQIKHEIANIVPMPNAGSATGAAPHPHAGAVLGTVLRWLVSLAAIAAVALIGFRHPFIGRRLLLMIPTLLIVSALVFSVVQLPPGDFISARVQELELTGDASASAQIEDLRTSFHLEESVTKRYLRWIGLVWFTSFRAEDQGLLQGNLGRSMEYNRPVNDIVGDRILLTLVISGFTILLTWAIALPTGIYAAVRQYSFGDYFLTFLGFLGMSVPAFLAALVLIYLSNEWLGLEITGLFSPRYATQTGWSWGKIVDLLQHIWVPVLVLGLSGTAGMIRVMRANLLDELRKPYVTAARARGCRPLRLLLRYPVRIALNPFVSGLGSLFPHLLSGGAIIALVLSLPIIGPEMLTALLNQDTYFAGSMLIVLSLLGVFGTLISDLLLLWLDPRIRMGRGKR